MLLRLALTRNIEDNTGSVGGRCDFIDNSRELLTAERIYGESYSFSNFYLVESFVLVNFSYDT